MWAKRNNRRKKRVASHLISSGIHRSIGSQLHHEILHLAKEVCSPFDCLWQDYIVNVIKLKWRQSQMSLIHNLHCPQDSPSLNWLLLYSPRSSVANLFWILDLLQKQFLETGELAKKKERKKEKEIIWSKNIKNINSLICSSGTLATENINISAYHGFTVSSCISIWCNLHVVGLHVEWFGYYNL